MKELPDGEVVVVYARGTATDDRGRSAEMMEASAWSEVRRRRTAEVSDGGMGVSCEGGKYELNEVIKMHEMNAEVE